MDLRTIATGLATTIGTLTVGSESATATARLPNQIGTLALLVYPPEGDLSFLMGPKLNAHIVFPVRLLRDPTDVPSRTDALLDWATVLWPRGQSSPGVIAAGVESESTFIRIEIDGQKYSRVDDTFATFDVVELLVDCHVYENTTFL